METGTSAVLILIDNDFDDMELMYPKLRLQEAGYQVVVSGLKANELYRGRHGYPCRSDQWIFDVHEPYFRGIVCPGGMAAASLRREEKIKSLLAQFHHSGKLIASICTGGWIPISAGVYRGVHATGSLEIKDDLINAGVIFKDAPVVIDRHFVSSRKAEDLPAFMKAVLEVLAAHPVASQATQDKEATLAAK